MDDLDKKALANRLEDALSILKTLCPELPQDVRTMNEATKLIYEVEQFIRNDINAPRGS
jgi:hypothetical protein